MPANDIDAFEYVLSDSDTALEIDYLTYAMFAFKKKEWIDHFKKNNSDVLPTQQQVDDWISQLSDYDFYQMRQEAASFFQLSAKEFLSDYVNEQRTAAVDKSILATIKSYTNPWKDIGIALIFAILAPVILGTVIFLISIFDNSFQIHISLGSHPPSQASEPSTK